MLRAAEQKARARARGEGLERSSRRKKKKTAEQLIGRSVAERVEGNGLNDAPCGRRRGHVSAEHTRNKHEQPKRGRTRRREEDATSRGERRKKQTNKQGKLQASSKAKRNHPGTRMQSTCAKCKDTQKRERPRRVGEFAKVEDRNKRKRKQTRKASSVQAKPISRAAVR